MHDIVLRKGSSIQQFRSYMSNRKLSSSVVECWISSKIRREYPSWRADLYKSS
ncbi:hypothetical protein BX666DRAFT_1904550 [Dichotomocladium elegans]|nr:hypothetical protein BX666DRAFT_1904550 [Dichotomocladium elegans]